MRRPDLIDLQAIAFITGAVILRFTGAALAQDCGQAVPTPICLSWAPISGDVSADRCYTARADRAALDQLYDSTRPRTIADTPLPSHDAILNQLQAAADRVSRDCAGADLQ